MIENKPLISVIVPVYNVEKYISECAQSILMQTFDDYEIIFVDDGSPDNSGAICDEYAQKYKNVRVIHKTNGGLSDARNAGILSAKGEYLLFIDSDDFYDDNMFFEKLNNIIVKQSPDCIVFSMKIFNEEKGTINPSSVLYDENTLNAINVYTMQIKALIQQGKFVVSACSHLIKRELILNGNLFFKKGLLGEDIEWALRLYAQEMKLYFSKEQPYIYRNGRSGSITSSIGEKNIEDLYETVSCYADMYEKSDDEIKQLLLHYVAYQYIILCGLLVRLKNIAFLKAMIKKIKNYRWLLKYNLVPKVKKTSWIGQILGIRALVTVLGLYIKYGR